MPQRADSFDLSRMTLVPGEGRRLELAVAVDGFDFSGQHYAVVPSPVDVRLDVARMAGAGYSLRLRFTAQLDGPCFRCLEAATPAIAVDAREIERPGGGDELESPYVTDEELDLRSWARDALALALPAQIVCRDDCVGLCPVCGENLNAAQNHAHDPGPDPRWAKLRELRLE